MKNLIISLFILLGIPSYSQCLKADIVFLLDWSGSEAENKRYISEAALDFILNLKLGPSSTKIGIIPFNTIPIADHCQPLTSDSVVLLNNIINLHKTVPSGNTGYLMALSLAQNYFNISENERGEPVLKIIVFISDGEENHNDWLATESVASTLKNDNINIWSIMTVDSSFNNELYIDHMKNISSGTDYFMQQDYEGLKQQLQTLELCP